MPLTLRRPLPLTPPGLPAAGSSQQPVAASFSLTANISGIAFVASVTHVSTVASSRTITLTFQLTQPGLVSYQLVQDVTNVIFYAVMPVFDQVGCSIVHAVLLVLGQVGCKHLHAILLVLSQVGCSSSPLSGGL